MTKRIPFTEARELLEAAGLLVENTGDFIIYVRKTPNSLPSRMFADGNWFYSERTVKRLIKSMGSKK